MADSRLRKSLIWGALVLAIAVPIAASLASPLLAWRDPIYIAAGVMGVFAMTLLLVQPMLIGNFLPGHPTTRNRTLHKWVGSLLLIAVLLHVVGLWLTSPPDVIDALLFASPTPFSAWGVVAMWAVLFAGFLAVMRKHLRPRVWRAGHTILVGITVAGSIVHALLIEGTMETVSKIALCGLVLLATGMAITKQQKRFKRKGRPGRLTD